MTTKEWLQRAYNIDRQIKSKLELIEMWKDLAAKCTSSYSLKAGGGSQKGDGYKYYAMISDAEAEAEEQTKQLIKIKREVESAISKVASPYYRILLEQRYLLCKNWVEIAEVLGYDATYVCRDLHRYALREVENARPH